MGRESQAGATALAWEGLRVPLKRRKRQRLGDSAQPARRLSAERPNHVWALDVQFDQTAEGTLNDRMEPVVDVRVVGATGLEQRLAAVVDMGFSGFLTIPEDVAADLSLPINGMARVVLADDSEVYMRMYTTTSHGGLGPGAAWNRRSHGATRTRSSAPGALRKSDDQALVENARRRFIRIWSAACGTRALFARDASTSYLPWRDI